MHPKSKKKGQVLIEPKEHMVTGFSIRLSGGFAAMLSCVHIKHLGRIISDLGLGLVDVNTLGWIISDLARPA